MRSSAPSRAAWSISATMYGCEIVWPSSIGSGESSYASPRIAAATKACRGMRPIASMTRASRMPRAASCRATIQPRCWRVLVSSSTAAAADRKALLLAVRLQPLQLGGVEVVLVARQAVVDRDREMATRRGLVAESPVGDAEPEVELVVRVGARDLAREELAGSAPIVALHRRHAELEEIERRVRLERGEPRARAARVGVAAQPLVRHRQVGERARVARFGGEDALEDARRLAEIAVAQVDDTERVE